MIVNHAASEVTLKINETAKHIFLNLRIIRSSCAERIPPTKSLMFILVSQNEFDIYLNIGIMRTPVQTKGKTRCVQIHRYQWPTDDQTSLQASVSKDEIKSPSKFYTSTALNIVGFLEMNYEKLIEL